MRIIQNYFFWLILVLLLFAAELFFFLFADIKLILDLIPDDAAYYFKIAEIFNKGEIQAFISLGIFVLFVFSQSLNAMESALLVFLLVIIYRKAFSLQKNG